MELQIGKWGNSLAIRLPARLAKQAGLCEGGRVQALVTAGRELHIVGTAATPTGATRAQLAGDIEKMHKDWPMGHSVVRWMRDQGY